MRRDNSSPAAKALTALAVTLDSSVIEWQRRPTEVASFEACSAYRLDDEVALEFGDRPDDDDHGAAQRAAVVDLFAEADELDVKPVQFIEYFEEVFY